MLTVTSLLAWWRPAQNLTRRKARKGDSKQLANKLKEQMLRCNHCRTRRSTGTLLFRHLLDHPGCAPCQCGGYHFPHRKGSTYCEANVNCFPNRASRQGATDEEVAEIKRRMTAELEDCPF